MSEQSISAQFIAKLQDMEPRAYKSDGSGTIAGFSLDEVHLDANDNPISVSGSITYKTGQGSQTQTIPALWNAVGKAFQNNAQMGAMLDLVKKVPFNS